LYTIVYGPVPAVAVHFSDGVPVLQNGPFTVRLPCGSGLTVIVALLPVIPVLLEHVVVSSVTETIWYVTDELIGEVKGVNAVPLTTPVFVRFVPPFSV
jgi:hypothetical protein